VNRKSSRRLGPGREVKIREGGVEVGREKYQKRSWGVRSKRVGRCPARCGTCSCKKNRRKKLPLLFHRNQGGNDHLAHSSHKKDFFSTRASEKKARREVFLEAERGVRALASRWRLLALAWLRCVRRCLSGKEDDEPSSGRFRRGSL